MRKLSLGEIRAMPATDVVSGLRGRQFSLLQSLGFHKMRAEMNFTGFVCRAIIAMTGLSKEPSPDDPHIMNLKSRGRQRVVRILDKAAPCSMKGYFQHLECGMVVGFNHPSLGEILRFIRICAEKFGSRINLFPVNLPWYEAIMPIVHDLEKIGVYVMPVITPSTKRKMAKKANTETMAVVEDLSTALNGLYLQKCAEFIKNNDNIWVAPTATRQKTVFKSRECRDGLERIEPQTMTLLALYLRRNHIKECTFQVVGVVPPGGFKRGLNLFGKYRMGIGDAISMDVVNEKCRNQMPCTGSEFEYDFLTRIARVVKELDNDKLEGENLKIIIPEETET